MNNDFKMPASYYEPPEPDSLWEKAWEIVDSMDWDEKRETVGTAEAMMCCKDDHEWLDERCAEEIYEGLCDERNNGCDI